MPGLPGSDALGKWVTPIALPKAVQGWALAWLVPLDRPELIGTVEPLLSQDELTRARRFVRAESRRQFSLSHGALRLILAEYLGCRPTELSFGATEKGKPFLRPNTPHDLRFNLSHSSDRALISLSPGRETGVDIERVQLRPDLQQIAERFWAPAEIQALRQTPAPEQLGVFYRLWTRKESVLKAAGRGITEGLREPDMSAKPLSPGTLAEIKVQLAETSWLVCDLDPGQHYAAALTVADA